MAWRFHPKFPTSIGHSLLGVPSACAVVVWSRLILGRARSGAFAFVGVFFASEDVADVEMTAVAETSSGTNITQTYISRGINKNALQRSTREINNVS